MQASFASAGAFFVLCAMFSRAMTPVTAFPYWDFDPTVFEASLSGWGPAGSLACDAVILLGCGLCFLARGAPGQRGAWTWVGPALVLAGCVPVLHHGWLGPVASIQHQRVGAAWASALLAAMALRHVGHDPRLRALAFASVLGFVIMLALRGAQQMLFEHGATVADYLRNKAQILAAQGWSADSPMAKGYERRLFQNEATGWFGLANVYATFVAAGAVGFLGLLLGALRAPPASPTPRCTNLVLAISSLAVLVAVVMAGAKGGYGALVLGVGVLAGLHWLPGRARRLLAWAPVALVALVLAGVVARGLVGERLGELSLLFRWYYMEAAVRIARGFTLGGAHVGDWLLGVGPDGFKDAYLLAKNPLSPEEVASPHSMLLDWWACLGAFGLAWCLLFLAWLRSVGRVAASTFESQGPADAAGGAELASFAHGSIARDLVRLSTAIAVAAGFVSMLSQRNALSPSLAGVYLAGLLAWSVVSGFAVVLLLRLPTALTQPALAGAAVVFAVHGQIEVTGSNPASLGLLLATIAMASVRCEGAEPEGMSNRERSGRSPARILAAISLVGAGALAWFGVLPAQRWEGALQGAAETLRPIAEARSRMSEGGAASPSERLAILKDTAELLSASLGRKVAPDPAGITSAMDEAQAKLAELAIERLPWGSPRDWRLDREVLRLAELHRFAAGREFSVETLAGRRVSDILGPGEPDPSGAGFAGAPSSLLLSISQFLESVPGDRPGAVAALDAALAKDPYNLLAASRRLSLLQLSPATPAREVQAAARRVLELDDLLRLDPLRRLGPQARARAERAAAGAN